MNSKDYKPTHGGYPRRSTSPLKELLSFPENAKASSYIPQSNPCRSEGYVLPPQVRVWKMHQMPHKAIR